MSNENSAKNIILNALVKKNPILVSGMVIAPVVVTANTFLSAATLALTFSVITFFTLVVSSFVPKRIVYTVRIILYTLIGALVYVPSVIILNSVIPGEISKMGIFFPLLITNSLIISRSETIFFRESKGQMILDIVFCIIGYDAAVLLYGLIREVLSAGTAGGKMLGMPYVFSALEYPFGGFILLGAAAALFRFIFMTVKRAGQK
ncbi:MAG: electron transport complex subunit E [Oscillospiraceae bacterium]|nr:electron transport complex subunit E [Oscillospiraceae bacterium]